MGFPPRDNEVESPTERRDLEVVVANHDFRSVSWDTIATFLPAPVYRAPKSPPRNDPHWKRVEKDRKRKAAAKKHKQHMRRRGK